MRARSLSAHEPLTPVVMAGSASGDFDDGTLFGALHANSSTDQIQMPTLSQSTDPAVAHIANIGRNALPARSAGIRTMHVGPNMPDGEGLSRDWTAFNAFVQSSQPHQLGVVNVPMQPTHHTQANSGPGGMIEGVGERYDYMPGFGATVRDMSLPPGSGNNVSDAALRGAGEHFEVPAPSCVFNENMRKFKIF